MKYPAIQRKLHPTLNRHPAKKANLPATTILKSPLTTNSPVKANSLPRANSQANQTKPGKPSQGKTSHPDNPNLQRGLNQNSRVKSLLKMPPNTKKLLNRI